MQALGGVALSVGNDLLFFVRPAETGGKLGCDDHLVTVAALLHPLADPLFRLLVLVVVGSTSSSAPTGLCSFAVKWYPHTCR